MKKITSLLLVMPLFFWACTDLEVEELDSVIIESSSGEFSGVDPSEGITSAYNRINGFGDQANLYALLEVTSDELLVPTRGTDWGDNGVWRTLHQHTWDATHAHVLSTWNNLNSNVFQLNQVLAPASGANTEQIAAAKFLRAYNMFLILDLWGQIPYRDVNDGVDFNPIVYSGQEAFDFILSDLNDAIPNLPSVGPSDQTRFASKASAQFLLAKLYLNKNVYLGGEPQAADMTKVVDAVDAIQDEGFGLHDGFFDIFAPDVDSETIFWAATSVGNRIWNSLHYNVRPPDNTGGGWNGFSTTAEFYNLFEGPSDSNAPGMGQEERRGFVPTDNLGYGFLVGLQYDINGTGNPLTDRSGNPLVYTKTFPGLAGNNERNGIRLIKYHPDNGSYASHLILFRYADAHLMKAEAIARGGSSSETALALVNELRVLRDATPLPSVTMQDLLDERGRELYIEGWRRNDQIRFGVFADTWPMKDVTETFRTKFPIPSVAVSTNPNLVQNEGY